MVKCLQLNTNRQILSIGEIKLRASQEEFEVAFIQEPNTYVRNGKHFVQRINGGKSFYINDNNRPRAVIWINNDRCRKWNPTIIKEISNEDSISVNIRMKMVKGDFKEIVITSNYMDGRINSCEQDLEKQLAYGFKHKKGIVWCSDTNAHNMLWGDKRNDSRSKVIVQSIDKYKAVLCNEGDKPTWEQNNRTSCIDITVVSWNIKELISDWHVSDKLFSSDHKPIFFEIKTTGKEREVARIKRKTNWSEYEKGVEKDIMSLEWKCENSAEMNLKANQLNKILKENFEKNNREIKIRNKYYMDWFGAKLHEQRRDLRRRWRAYIESDPHHKVYNFKKYQKAKGEYLRDVYKARSKAWGKKLSEIESVKDTAKMMKIIERGKEEMLTSLKKEDGSFTTNDNKTNGGTLSRLHHGGRGI
jgi:Endonuclease-reverse transcriptase